MKNNTGYLIKQRFNTLFFHGGRIATFVIFLAIFLVLQLISLITINGSSATLLNNIYLIINACVFGILMISLTLSVIRGEVTNNQVNLELREGYKPRQIYFARLVELMFDFAVFMVIATVVNLIVIAAAGKMNDVIWYHMFVTSLGWYAIVGIIGIGMAGFFCTFWSSAAAGTIATCVVMICALVGGFINGLMGYIGGKEKNPDDNSAKITQNIIYSRMTKFINNDLGITNYNDWKDIEDSIISKVPDENDHGFHGGNDHENPNPIVDKVNFGGLKDSSNKLNFYKDFYKYMSGQWNSENEHMFFGRQSYPNWNSVVADFAGFGNEVVGNDKLANFFTDVDNAFRSVKINFTYKDMTNWTILDGKHSRSVRSGSTYSTEDFKGILKAVENSELGKKYSFIKEIINWSDASVLSSMYNSSIDGTNANNDYLYPLFGIGGYVGSQNNIQQVFKQLTPLGAAEYVFNRNVFYFVSMAMDNVYYKLMDNSNSAWVGYAYNELTGTGTRNGKKIKRHIELRVDNPSNTRILGQPVYKAPFKNGQLSNSIKDKFDIYIADQAGKRDPLQISKNDIEYVKRYESGYIYINFSDEEANRINDEIDHWSGDNEQFVHVDYNGPEIYFEDSLVNDKNHGSYNDYVSNPYFKGKKDSAVKTTISSLPKDFYKVDIKGNKAKDTLLSLIYNPLTQLSSMFNGVNYKDTVKQNLWDSYKSENLVGVGNLIVEQTINESGNGFDNITVNAKRTVYPEFIYIEYTVIEALILFAGYWIYRKKIVA